MSCLPVVNDPDNLKQEDLKRIFPTAQILRTKYGNRQPADELEWVAGDVHLRRFVAVSAGSKDLAVWHSEDGLYGAFWYANWSEVEERFPGIKQREVRVRKSKKAKE